MLLLPVPPTGRHADWRRRCRPCACERAPRALVSDEATGKIEAAVMRGGSMCSGFRVGAHLSGLGAQRAMTFIGSIAVCRA